MDLEARIRRVLARVLDDGEGDPGLDLDLDLDLGLDLDLDASFVDLGINSLRSVAAVELLNEELGTSLGIEVMFDCQDVAELAAFVRAEHGDELAAQAQAHAPAVAAAPAARSRPPVEAREADVAIVGMSGRFAGARDLDELWQRLEDGQSCVGEIDRAGWHEADYYDPDPRRPGRSISRWGGLLDGVDVFDPRFFGISPAEAECLDPQQRLFLEESYRAFEDGGYAPDGLAGRKVGVFVGARGSDYKDQAVRAGATNSQVFLGTDQAILAARISYFLDLRGPNLTVDTACSSSLVAIHLAVQSIRRGEAEMALAGGVFVVTSPEFYVLTSQTNMLSPDGACKTFDESADGIAIGEGVGAVVLKSLAAALADGDHVHAVIKGSAVNQDGRTKGITAPSMRSQKALLHDAYADAGVDPETLGYLEAHGTGTKLGDPIEVKALAEVLRRYTDRREFCAVGSHKGNLGHTIVAAGIAGVFKTVLAMRHGKLPPTLHVRELNRHLDLAGGPLYVNTRLRDWERPETHPRRAGVSSFGFGGTNAHVVLEEAPRRAPAAQPRDRAHLFPLSATTPEALSRRVAGLLAWLQRPVGDLSLVDVAYTLSVGRTHFAHRMAVVAGDLAELSEALRAAGSAPAFPGDTARERLLDLAETYRHGGDVDWPALFAGGGRRRVALPTYPFAGESYWIGGPLGDGTVAAPLGAPLGDGTVAAPLGGPLGDGTVAAPLGGPPGDGTAAAPPDVLLLEPTWSPAAQRAGQLPAQAAGQLPAQPAGQLPAQPAGQLPAQSAGQLPAQAAGQLPAQRAGQLPAQRVVLAGEAVPQLAGLLGDAECIRLGGFEAAAVRLVQELRGRLSAAAGPLLVQLVVTHEGGDRLLGGLLGMLLSAAREHPRLRGQLVEVAAGASASAVAAWLDEAGRLPSATRVRASASGLLVAGWTPLPAPATPPPIPWREGGVYLITGGRGGLGRRLVAEISRRVGSATIVLVGRSRDIAPARTAAGGVRVEYRCADVGDHRAVDALLEDVLAMHGTVTGVVHAAGVVTDGLLSGTTADQVRAVLAPKVAGTLHLDEATRHVPLDFFVLFGSITGPLGVVGRGAYAAANAFLDRFAAHRAELQARGERHGRTVAIDWPVWAEGGMRVDEDTLAAMRRDMGLEPMPTPQGLQALYEALSSGRDQVLVAAGDGPRLRDLLVGAEGSKGASPPPPLASPAPGEMLARLRAELTALAARFLRVEPAELDAGTDLHTYGFDSITLTAFTNRLNETYEMQLTPPVLFEHITLASLCEHLADTYAAAFAARWATPQRPTSPETFTPAASSAPAGVAAVSAGAAHRPRAGAAGPVAVIGMSGTFPQAPDVASLWANLLAGTDAVGTGLDARWGPRGGSAADFPWAGLIEDVDMFDAAFFGISAFEAEQMDPQQRLLMMFAWKAIEDAGYAPGSLAGSDTGLFIATFDSGYGPSAGPGRAVEAHTAIGQTPSLGPSRLSYHLDLHGPSEPIETACSSSLVALHRAVTAIALGECGLAVAGGVSLLIEPTAHTSLAKSGLLSPDGRCRTFSAQANGFVRGEGAGMLVLKPLDQAERDGDHVYGLIRATAVNHGGHAQSLTAPHPRAQADLLVAAYRRAGVDPASVGYIEAHGTGTKLGDPIEINGLTAAFEELYREAGREPPRAPHCGLGSIKSAIGHLELAAGVAGVIKVLMQLRHATLVAGLHTRPANPYIDLDASPFYVVEETAPWPAPHDADGAQLPRRAGVSSFGIGGVNAHAVLEEHVPQPADAAAQVTPEHPALVVLSARTAEALREQATQLLDFVRTGGCAESDLGRLAYTLQVGRDAMEHRLAMAAASLDELSGKLARFLAGDGGNGTAWHEARVGRHRDAVAMIAEDEDLRQAARGWLQRGRHAKVLEWWACGLDVDWDALHAGGKPRRMSLPTYPFARERHWLPAVPAPTSQQPLRPAPPRRVRGAQPPRTAGSYAGPVRQHLAAAFANRSLNGTEEGTR